MMTERVDGSAGTVDVFYFGDRICYLLYSYMFICCFVLFFTYQNLASRFFYWSLFYTPGSRKVPDK